MGLFSYLKKQVTQKTVNQAEFDRDIRELLACDDTQNRQDICEAEFEKARWLLISNKKEDNQKAYYLLENLASQFNYIPAIMRMGEYSEKNLMNPQKTAFWYKKAADLGDGNAARRYADCLINGNGTPRDVDLALHYYSDAADKGIPEAAFALGEYFLNSGDRENALKAYRRSAEKWYTPALDRLHQMEIESGLHCAKCGHAIAEDERNETPEGIFCQRCFDLYYTICSTCGALARFDETSRWGDCRVCLDCFTECCQYYDPVENEAETEEAYQEMLSEYIGARTTFPRAGSYPLEYTEYEGLCYRVKVSVDEKGLITDISRLKAEIIGTENEHWDGKSYPVVNDDYVDIISNMLDEHLFGLEDEFAELNLVGRTVCKEQLLGRNYYHYVNYERADEESEEFYLQDFNLGNSLNAELNREVLSWYAMEDCWVKRFVDNERPTEYCWEFLQLDENDTIIKSVCETESVKIIGYFSRGKELPCRRFGSPNAPPTKSIINDLCLLLAGRFIPQGFSFIGKRMPQTMIDEEQNWVNDTEYSFRLYSAYRFAYMQVIIKTDKNRIIKDIDYSTFQSYGDILTDNNDFYTKYTFPNCRDEALDLLVHIIDQYTEEEYEKVISTH